MSKARTSPSNGVNATRHEELQALAAELVRMKASKFELVIDLRAAHAVGIEVPQMLLHRADEVLR